LLEQSWTLSNRAEPAVGMFDGFGFGFEGQQALAIESDAPLGSVFLERQAAFLETQESPESGGLPGNSRPGARRRFPSVPQIPLSDDGASMSDVESGGMPGSRPAPRQVPSTLGTVPLPELPAKYKPNMPAKSRKLEAEFSEGLQVKTEDGYFTLVFHNLTQVDYRGFNPTGDPLHSQFVIPRQRWYLVGNISPYARYYTVINRGYGTLDLLDAFLDLNFGQIEAEKFQVRIGRMKTPYTYEYIKVAETDLIAPERSVFVSNLAGNRQEGAMAHGDLLERRLEYAVGVFNGPRRSFTDYDNSKDLYTFFNVKPFLKGDVELLQELNISGSFNYGNEHNPLQPASLTTANDQSPSASVPSVSPTFFTFNTNVFENGPRSQWAGDVAYYYRSFGLLAGYQGGFQTYGISPTAIPSNFVGVSSTANTRVPLEGWSLSTFYFVTGEQITRRVNLLEPRRSFGERGGIGAIELFARFANLNLGANVFTAGLANAALWSNRANVTDLGVNWYLNHYLKLTFDYQYSDFGKPVQLSPSKMTSYMNLFWFRTQLYF